MFTRPIFGDIETTVPLPPALPTHTAQLRAQLLRLSSPGQSFTATLPEGTSTPLSSQELREDLGLGKTYELARQLGRKVQMKSQGLRAVRIWLVSISDVAPRLVETPGDPFAADAPCEF